MDQKEHLDRIVARCRELLAVAEKRTPGRWIREFEGVWLYEGDNDGARCVADCHSHHTRGGQASRDNADFIASCAGAAEAGWRATIVAVECIRKELLTGWDGECEPDHPSGPELRDALAEVIAAWPEELL